MCTCTKQIWRHWHTDHKSKRNEDGSVQVSSLMEMANGHQVLTDMAWIKDLIVKTLWIPLLLWAGRVGGSCFYGSKNLIPQRLCMASAYVYPSLTMRLPGESSQNSSFTTYRNKHRSHLFSGVLTCLTPHYTVLGRHTNVPAMHSSGIDSGMHTLWGHCRPPLRMAASWGSPKEVSSHFHPDTALCLNKQVGQYSMSAIFTYLIP